MPALRHLAGLPRLMTRLGCVAALALQAAAAAEPPAAAAPAAPAPASGPCVEVDISGYRAGNVECAAARLNDAARAAQAQARNNPPLDVPGVNAPASQVGGASVSALRQRLGQNLGHSVQPPRPPPPPPGPARP